jgi:hypothetical protein
MWRETAWPASAEKTLLGGAMLCVLLAISFYVALCIPASVGKERIKNTYIKGRFNLR